ncbi:MAG: hypothetical protein ABW046_02710 [Actinoplanes sp.]
MSLSSVLAAALLPLLLGAAPAEVPYDAAGTLTTSSGQVEYTISAPEAVTLHESDIAFEMPYLRPGKPLAPMVRVRVGIRGITGQVTAGADVQLVYEAPDGTLASETLPIAPYEKVDLLLSHPATVTAGQRTGGEIYFDSAVPGGKVIAGDIVGTRLLAWRSPAT